MIDSYCWIDDTLCDRCQHELYKLAASKMPPEMVDKDGYFIYHKFPEVEDQWHETLRATELSLRGRCLRICADMDVVVACKRHLREMIGKELDD